MRCTTLGFRRALILGTGVAVLGGLVPALAAALPTAIHAAATEGRFEGLFGLTTAFAGGKGMKLAAGMHFSVICAEDVPRLAGATDKPTVIVVEGDSEEATSEEGEG